MAKINRMVVERSCDTVEGQELSSYLQMPSFGSPIRGAWQSFLVPAVAASPHVHLNLRCVQVIICPKVNFNRDFRPFPLS